MSAASTGGSNQLATRSSGLLSRLAAARDAERAASGRARGPAAAPGRAGHPGRGREDPARALGPRLLRQRRRVALHPRRDDAPAHLPSPEDSSDGLAVLGYLADEQGRAYDHLKTLLAAQDDATAKAAAAARRAQDAAAAALAAKTALDRSVAEQRAALTRYRAAQAAQVGAASGLRGDLLRAGSAAARAADARLARALRAHGGAAGLKAGADCSPGDTRDYPNGKVPASALCPLYGSPDERLREDPARAFNAMSRAYEHDTGSPLCVTDGYRPLAEQFAVARATPNLAARPGHEPPRPRHRGRPVRRGAELRHRGPPVDAAERAAVRLVPPGLGRAVRVHARAVALGVRRLSTAVAVRGPDGALCQASRMISAAHVRRGPRRAAAAPATSAPGTGTTGPTRPTSRPPRRSCSPPTSPPWPRRPRARTWPTARSAAPTSTSSASRSPPAPWSPYTLTLSTIVSALVLIFVGAIADRSPRPTRLFAGFAWAGAAAAAADVPRHRHQLAARRAAAHPRQPLPRRVPGHLRLAAVPDRRAGRAGPGLQPRAGPWATSAAACCWP